MVSIRPQSGRMDSKGKRHRGRSRCRLWRRITNPPSSTAPGNQHCSRTKLQLQPETKKKCDCGENKSQYVVTDFLQDDSAVRYLNVKGDYHHNLHRNIVWLHIPVVFSRINASHNSPRRTNKHKQAHNSLKLPLLRIKSDFIPIPASSSSRNKVERQNHSQSCKNKEVGEMLRRTASIANAAVRFNPPRWRVDL